MKWPWQRREVKESATAQVGVVNMPAMTFGKKKPEDYAKEGYQKNAIVFKCVNAISTAAARVPFKLFNGDREVETHPVLDLLQRPNPVTGQYEFFEALYSFLLITGDSFLERVSVGRGIREMYILPPQNIEVKPGRSQIPSEYIFVAGQSKVRFGVDPVSGQSDILQIKLFNPIDPWRGQSPLQAAGISVDTHNLAGQWLASLLNNNAVPSGALVYKPADNIDMTEDQRRQLEKILDQKFSGSQNAGRPMVLGNGLEWVSFGATPKDMGAVQIKESEAVAIAQAYDVPAQLVGVAAASTFSNMQEAREWLYTNAVLNLVEQVRTELNHWLLPAFGPGLRLEVDKDSIDALESVRARRRQSVIEMVAAGLISVNEGRETLGFGPVSGGDQVLVPAGRLPLDFEAMPGSDEIRTAAELLGYER